MAAVVCSVLHSSTRKFLAAGAAVRVPAAPLAYLRFMRLASSSSSPSARASPNACERGGK